MVANSNITVTGGLSQKGTKRNFLTKMIGSFVPVSSRTRNRAPQDDPALKAVPKFQQIMDSINYYDTLTAAIVHSNARTTIKVNDQDVTIAQVLDYKANVVPVLKQLRDVMKAQLSQAVSMKNQSNDKAEKELKQLLQLQSEVKAGTEENDENAQAIEDTTAMFWRSRKYVLVDPLNVEVLIEDLNQELHRAGRALDHALSTSNAKTVLNFGDVTVPDVPEPVAKKTISVAVAMTEKTELMEKMQNIISSTTFVSATLACRNRSDDPVHKAVEKFEEFQQLLAHRQSIVANIVRSNLATTVNVGSKQLTVTHAIEMKHSHLPFLKSLLSRLQTEKDRVSKHVAECNKQCATNLNSRIEQFARTEQLTKKDSTNNNATCIADSIVKMENSFWDNNSWEMVDLLGIDNHIEHLEAKIQELSENLDTQLSQSNALTEITF